MRIKHSNKPVIQKGITKKNEIEKEAEADVLFRELELEAEGL